MKKWPGQAFRGDRRHHQLYRPSAGYVAGADNQLYAVVAAHIGDKAGILRTRSLKNRVAAIRLRSERPAVAQRLRQAGIRIVIAKDGGLADPDGNDGSGAGDDFGGSVARSRGLLVDVAAWAAPAAAQSNEKDTREQQCAESCRSG